MFGDGFVKKDIIRESKHSVDRVGTK